MKEWKEFENNEITHSMAHYLMAIHELHKRQGYARMTDVARELEITAGSASTSLKTLKAKGWVDEDHNKFLRLSPQGEKLAHEINVSNKLLVQFLTEVLGLNDTQASIDACKMEHLLSSDLRKKMLAFMHFIHEDHKPVKDFLKAWKAHSVICPGPDECDVCHDGHECAVHEKAGAALKLPASS